MNPFNTTLQLTSIVPSDLYLKVTSDGLQDIPLSFSKIPIDFFVSVASDCSTLAHYTSGYLTDVKLKTKCIVLDDQYSYTTESFSNSTECFEYTGTFVKGTLSVYASAMSGVSYFQETSECACNSDEIIRWDRKRSPNTKIYVEGIFDVNGSVQTLTGESNFFDLVPYEDFYQIKRKSENKTLVERMQRLVVDRKLKENSAYWELMNGMFGDEITDLNYALNVKIANFSDDNMFIDTLNYKVIKNVKGLFGEEFPSFEIYNIPDSVERHLNIGTIDDNRLFGYECACNMNFQTDGNCGTQKCKLCRKAKTVNNLGEILNSESQLSAGVPILYKAPNSNFNVLYPTVQNGLSTYSLASLTAQNINDRTDVCFYEWNMTPQKNLIGNFLLMGDDLDNKTRVMADDRESWDDILTENLFLDMHKIVE